MRTCPLGHTCDSCLWHVHLRGKNPQSTQEIDEVRCAMVWLPLLLVENSQQQMQTSAAVESFREAMLKQNDSIALAYFDRQELLENDAH
jgi:hypothetical protein